MTDPLSILHIVAPAPFGGLESVLHGLAAGQTRARHKVLVALVLSPNVGEHPFARALVADGVSISEIRTGDRNYLGERRAVDRLCARHSPDVVHTHGFRPDVVDGGVARARNISVVSTCHGFIDAGWRGRLYQWLDRRALRRFDAVVAVSEPIARRLSRSGVELSRIHLVQNSFAAPSVLLHQKDARRTMELPLDGILIGWVGRLSAEKGADVAIDAFARLETSVSSQARDSESATGDASAPRLVIIGAGPDEKALRARAQKLGVADRVIFRGVVHDAGRLFPAFDAFLLSSRTEGTPMALLEAMASLVPIVATRVGGVPNILDGSSAMLADSEDVDGIATALSQTLRDQESARSRAQRARELLDERFSVSQWLARYDSIYRSVIRRTPRSVGNAA